MTANTKDNKNQQPKRANPYWIYAFLFFFLVIMYFQRSIPATREISWLQFEQNMLSQHDVEKVVVINKETAEIYIKQDKLTSEIYKDIASSRGTNQPAIFNGNWIDRKF